MHNLELREVILMEDKMERFLASLRVQILDRYLVQNLELGELLLMEAQVGRLFEVLRFQK